MEKQLKPKKEKKIKLVLIEPTGKGRIDPKRIRAAIKKVRDQRLKLQAQSIGV